jgi:hypothetical protein
MKPYKTLSNGTEILTEKVPNVGTVVYLDSAKAPADMRPAEAGRIIRGGYQPALLCAFALTPECLRALADLIEKGTDDV